MCAGGGERVDDRVHRRPEGRTEKDEGDRGQGRARRENEDDREPGEERRDSTDPQRRRALPQPGDGRARDRVDRRRSREEQPDLPGRDVVLAELQRHEQVDAAADDPDQHDDPDRRQHELVAPCSAHDLAQRLPGHLASSRGRRDDERNGDDGGGDREDQERRASVEAIRDRAREHRPGREAEPGDGRRRGQRSRAPLLCQRVREPRGPCLPTTRRTRTRTRRARAGASRTRSRGPARASRA